MIEKRKRKHESPYINLINILSITLKDIQLEESLLLEIPSKWERHGDLILFPPTSFGHENWKLLGNKLWNIVAETFKCKRIAIKHTICNDNFRSPLVDIMKGSDSWVLHSDNKIKYMYDITKCMFSAGNISEKIRIAKLSCHGETVVDLYAGIGYFTLPFLVHAHASLVHACEWNPYALEALSKTLSLNKVKSKCIIHYGDNREVCPKGVADRINLGLIPSSESGWETACKALKPSGGVMHVHGNVTSKPKTSPNDLLEKETPPSSKSDWMSWSEYVCLKMNAYLNELYSSPWSVACENTTRIKSYAPHIDHIVVDIRCKPCDFVS